MTNDNRVKSLRRPLLAAMVAVMGGLCFVPKVQATIAEQRARLPPPARCEDSVAGVWKSHQYTPRWGDWQIFTLEIHRVPGQDDQLQGLIRNESWQGGPTQEEPGACERRFHWLVSMDGRGRVQGNEILFGGTGPWRLDRVFCRRGPYAYNLDNFSGTIDPGIQEFQSVNNDGGRAVNEATVFRRIRCFHPDSRPHIHVDPPPLYPGGRTGGCGGW